MVSYCVFFLLFLLLSCIPTTKTALKGYKFQLSSDGDLSPTQITQNRLFLNASSLTIKCTLYDPDDISIARKNALISSYGSLNISPTLRILNSTWGRTYTFPTTVDTSSTTYCWKLEIPKLEISSSDTLWLPSEEWRVYVQMEDSGETFTTVTTLLDSSKEPLLQWQLGTTQSSLPAATTVSSVLTVSSPCSRDVAVVIPGLSNGDVYIGVTYTGFEDGQVVWYKLDGSCTGADCTIIAFLVTSHRMLLVNQDGVYVSNDLRVSSSGQPGEQINMALRLARSGDCDTIQEAKLSFAGHCQSRHHDLFRDDLVTLSYKCANGHGAAWYSREDFSIWHEVYSDTSRPSDFQFVMSVLYNDHMDSLNVLYNTTENFASVDTQIFSKDGSLDTKRLFPSFTFPMSSEIQGIFYHPRSKILYAYGKEIWQSFDGGNHFESLLTLPADKSVVGTATGLFEGVVSFSLSGSEYLYGKAGVNRLSLLEPSSMPGEVGSVYIDHLNLVTLVTVPDGASLVTRTVVDVNTLLLETNITINHPLAIHLMSPKEAFLYEHKPLADSAATTQFTESQVGMLLQLSGGGEGIIQAVRPERVKYSGFVNQIHLFITTSFKFESFLESPAQKHVLEIQGWDSSTGIATLALTDAVTGGDGWQTSDITKTVVIPFATAFLITGYTDDTHVQAQSVFPLSENLPSKSQGLWYIFNAGVDGGGTAMWSLRESECKHSMTSDLDGLTTFELDLNDEMSVSVLAYKTALRGLSSQPLLRATVSNPWVFQMNYHLSYQLSSTPSYQNLTVSVKDNILKQGLSVLRFHMPTASLLCPNTSYLITFYAGCPCRKRLIYSYPTYISDHDFLHGPLKQDNVQSLYELEVNYRPPSTLGLDIPMSKYIYNADPSQPIPRNRFKVSQQSVEFHMCKGKANKSQCQCTEEMELSSDAEFSDCRRRVYRILHPGVIRPYFTMTQPIHAEANLSDNYLITINEINDRDTQIIPDVGISSVLLTAMLKDQRFPNATQYLNPNDVKIIMNGSGLYHFRAQIIPGLSHCSLFAEFQFYIDVTPIAYPLQYIMNFAVAFVIGGLFFILYLYYLSEHHTHRIRKVGPLCPDARNITQDQGEYPPSKILAQQSADDGL